MGPFLLTLSNIGYSREELSEKNKNRGGARTSDLAV